MEIPQNKKNFLIGFTDEKTLKSLYVLEKAEFPNENIDYGNHNVSTTNHKMCLDRFLIIISDR